jgi:uncharacterized protein with FMN-binding domain
MKKKLLLSSLTVVAFLGYAVFQRVSGTAGVPGGGGTSTTLAGQGESYQNGKYVGDVAHTSWGDVQVQVVIDNRRIASVSTVQYPQDRPLSTQINRFAVPVLEQEAVQVQSAKVDVITGATVTCQGFMESLQNALSQAGG